MPVSQAQIAEEVGVSQRTVSAVLSGSGRVSEKTREKILGVAQAKGYVRNRLATGLRRGKTKSIGVIWEMANPWTGDSQIALRFITEFQDAGYAVYTAAASDSAKTLCNQIEDFLSRGVDALILHALPSLLCNPKVRQSLDRVSALLAVTRESIPDFRGDLVVHDRTRAIEQVVAHFAATGRTRPVMALNMEQESNPPKFEAFTRACQRHGIGVEGQMLIPLAYPDSPHQHGERHRDALRLMFPGEIDCDAIFCFHDVGALYVMRELADRGVRVPDDVAVVGFNNDPTGRVWRPALATGDRHRAEVAAQAAQLLKSRLDAPELPPRQATVHMTFINRESAGG